MVMASIPGLSFLWTVMAAGIAMMFADWLFMGVIGHDKYGVYPEIWRVPAGAPEPKLIAISTAMGFVSSAVFAMLCGHLGLHRFWATAHLALAIWIIVPLPLLINNGLWMKIHPAVTASHATGWLVKLLLAAGAVTLLLK